MAYDAVRFLTSLFAPARRFQAEDLPADVRVEYEERVGIMQFCGDLPRRQAEALALAEAVGRRGEGR